MKKSLLLGIAKAIIPCFSLLFSASLFNHSLAQNITGKVFRDFNANGLQSVTSPIEPGVIGVTVKVFKADGTQIGANQTTSLDGSYSVTVGNTNDYRVEFSNFPNAFFTGPKGTDSNTSVQFVKGGTTANLGINYPSDYCGTVDPQLITSCFENGTPFNNGTKISNSADDPFIVTIPYTPAATTGFNTYLSKAKEVGAVWGIAYQRSSKFIFASAFLKRHSGFGAGGPGAIYKIDNSVSPSVTTEFVNLNTDLSIAVGTDPRSLTIPADTLSTTKSAPNHDATAFGLVGKISLGDIDISDDEKTLWVINTFDGKLYELPIGLPATKPTTKIAHTLPDPGCVNGIFRPWAVKFWRGRIYVGGVCTAENSGGTAADLKAYIYSKAPSDASFTQVTTFPLNYTRGYVSRTNAGVSTSALWKPWVAQWSDIINPAPGAGAFGQTICPQPILSDIEFDVDGSMIIGLMDRAGHQLGNNNFSPTVTDLKRYEGTSGGDLLRLGLNTDGTYTLESNATVNGVVSGGTNQSPSQGPGGGEFYWQDSHAKNGNKDALTTHQEISLGGLALLPGKNEVVETTFDPSGNIRSGGVRWFNNITGASPRDYEVFGTDAGGGSTTFGKANGLGDLELLCAVQPIEVGNRLWNDIDKDGIQDAGEPVLAGVKVQLWKNGVQVGTDITTDAVTGEYYFTNLIPNQTDYEIRVPNINGIAKQAQLAGLTPTTANAGTNDETDSDATVTATYASIAFTTGNAGENNHTLDFGFACVTPKGGLDVIICDGSPTFDLPDAKAGIDAETWTVLTSPANPAAVINATTGVVTGMTTVGKYEFKLTNNATGCFDTVSIIVAPMIDAGANQTVCSPSTTTTVNAPSATQTWTVTTKPNGTTPLIATNGNVTGLTENGVYTFTLTEGTCSEIVQITRNDSPNAGADISTCGTTASVNSASISEIWTPVSSPANPSTATIDGLGNITGMINPGVYQFKLTADNGNGCSDIVAVTKSIGVDVTTQNLSVCTAGIIQLTANPTASGVTYFWEGPANFTSNLQNPSIGNASKPNEGIYTVTAVLGNCSATATSNVQFNEITVGIIGGFTNVCVGQDLVLRDVVIRNPTDPQVATYFWSGPNGTNTFTSSQASITIPTTSDMSQVGEYMLVETFDNGCTVTNKLTVSVTKCQKLGNLVWNDANNDGLNNNGELGVANVPVKLYEASNPTVSIANTTTDVNGKYLFSNLYPGFFIVEIEAPDGFKSSTGTNASATGAYEPAPDPNTPDVNDNDDGSKTTGQLIRSQPVELDNLTEPENDGDVTNGTIEDKNSNLTIDFGIFQPAQIGNFVWLDTNKNGIQDGGELGVSGVVINLYIGSNTTPIATATTLSDGKYLFDNLIAGTYTVEFVKTSIGAGNSFTKLAGTGNGEEDSNADLTTGKSEPITVAAGESNLSIDAGIIENCVPVAIGTISVPNLCAGQTLTLRATSSDPLATYTWSRAPSGFTATTQEIILPDLTVGSSVYTVLITNSNLCTSALTANVVVNPIPTISVNSVSICSGTTGILTATGATSYAWTGPNGAFTTTTADLSVNQQGIYAVTGTSNGCTAIATTSVTIYPKTVLTATGAAICLGGSGTISVLPAGLNYVWTGPSSFSSTQQTPSITNAADSHKGIYTVTVTDGNTCVSTATAAVLVGTVLTVTPTSNSPVCEGTRLDLSITGGTGARYLWTSPSGFTTSMQNPFTTNSTNADNGVWTVAVENADGCKGIGSTTVLINQALTGVTATVSASGCAGGIIDLTSTPAGAKSYEWSGTPAFTSSVQNPVITSAISGNYTFTVKVTNADGCTGTDTVSIKIKAIPIFVVNPVQATCTIGAANPDAKLIVSSTDATATYDYSEGITYTGTKTFATGTTITTPVTGLTNPNVDKSYTVRVFNSTGCYTDKTVILIPRICECKPDVCLPYSVRKTK